MHALRLNSAQSDGFKASEKGYCVANHCSILVREAEENCSRPSTEAEAALFSGYLAENLPFVFFVCVSTCEYISFNSMTQETCNRMELYVRKHSMLRMN